MSVVFVSMLVSQDENIIRLVEPVMRSLMEKMNAVGKINVKLKKKKRILFFFYI